jgi:hypothetical protein
VQLDDRPVQTINLNNPPVAVDKQLFQQPLFKQDDLLPGPHTITVTNMPSGNLSDIDIDYVSDHILVPRVLSPSIRQLSFTTNYDASHDVHVQSDAFQFNPPAAWTLFTDPGFDQGKGE